MRLRSYAFGLSVAGALSAPALVAAQTRPMVEHIEPTSGPPGTVVRIVGRGFTRSYRVSFGERAVTPREVLPERITVEVPAGAATGRWMLTNGSDSVETESFRVTAPEPAPAVSAVEPALAAAGSEVVLRGEHFAPRPADNQVRIGVLPMVVRSGDTTTLRVIVPDGAQSGPVFVRTGGGEGRSAGELTVAARLGVREFSPRAVAPGGRVVLRGSGFGSSAAQNRVSVGGQPARVLRASTTELEVQIPVAATTGTLVVEVQGAGRYETAQNLVVGPAPTITAIAPPQAAPGTRVTLRGSNFGSDRAAVSVTLGGRPVSVVSVAPNELVVTVPEGASTGRLAVTAGGIGPVESTADFPVLVPVSVARVEPRAGDVGDRVTLAGTGFSTNLAENTVQLGTVAARVVSATPTELVVEVPEGRSASWSITVANNGTFRTREPFMVTQRPRITAVEPPMGVAGSRVTLRGANFPAERSLATVQLNGQDVAVESYARDAIVVTVPRDAQNGRFQVIGRLQGTGTSPVDFVVLQPVRLAAVEPMAGPVGATVTLRGEGFEPDAARLRLRMGTLVLRPTRTSTTEIAFVVPRNARDGVLTVEADGRQTVDSPAPFRVTVAPVVTAIAPAAATAGTRLTIRGRNFGDVVANVGVTIGTVACPVAAVTPTQITCEVPAEAATGPVTVRVADAGEARGRAPLTVRPRP